MAGSMSWAVLGPIEVRIDDDVLDLGGAKQRAVLAALLIGAGASVSVHRLVADVWGERPPATAVGTLRAYVANLRRALEPDRPARAPGTILVSSPAGYRLCLRPNQLDAARFGALVESGRTALADGRAVDALGDLDRALGLWRGAAYAEFAGEPFAAPEAARLEEIRLAAQEERAEAELSAGRVEAAAAGLRLLVAGDPLRERRWELLALALYRGGRQAEALAALREARRVFDEEIGVAPGPRLDRLAHSILNQDPELHGAQRQRPSIVTTDGLAGRAEVTEGIAEALARAADGRGGLLLVTGEPGIGKTRVAEAATRQADALGFAVAVGRCPDDEGTPALWPWISVLRKVIETGGAPLAEQSERSGAAVLLGTGQPARADGREHAAGARSRLHAAVVEVLAEAARRRPLLVVLDDLHWADQDSLHVLRVLTTVLPELPLLVLVTCRDGADLTGPAAELVAACTGPSTSRWPLRRLTERDVELVLRQRFGADVDPRAARVIHQRCGGNPFHVVELARLLPTEDLESLADALPQGTNDLIRHRLRRLPQGAERLLATAAVLGEEFDFAVLAEAGDLDPEALLEILDTCVSWGLVVEVASVGRYRFSHALVRDTLRQSMPGLRLARLHARVAAALARRVPHAARESGELLDAVAFHWLAAAPVGHAEEAIAAATAAVERAELVHAYQHAAGLLASAVAVIDRHAVPRDPVGTRRLFELLVWLGRVCCRGAMQREAKSALHRAIGLARDLDDPTALAVAATTHSAESFGSTREYRSCDPTVVAALRDALRLLPPNDSRLRCLSMAALAVERYFDVRPDLREQSGHAAKAVDMARRLGDDDLLLRALHLHANAIRHPDTLARRQRIATELVALATGPGVGGDWVPSVLLRRALVTMEAGDMTSAQADIDACAEANRRVRLPEVEVHLRWWAALRAGLAGRAEEAESLSRQAYELHRHTVWGAGPALTAQLVSWRLDQGRYAEVAEALVAHEGSGDPITNEHLGLALALQGRLAEARRHCPPAARAPEPPHDWLWLLQMVVRAYTWALCGDVASSRWALARLLPYSGRTVTCGSGTICWGSIDHVLGELAATAGDTALATRLLRRSVRHNDELGCVRWQERSVARLAELTAEPLGA
ncbi:AAA family ATPase [Solihabitans fulvus]|uniref:AAA family ATPase n=1 Tax=Solihabitans fulvus TaxID=1892852 RepID=A0A5B2XT22_9PSEU|nr:BTAD domain-containing putative transcriptional regulator [Solihabitans fulvus]KAA2266019.1 AAA family ATPase [Solihabitans fulvus]